MTCMHEIATDAASQGWERWRCTSGTCRQARLHVTRRARGEDVWLIYERPGWVMAASMPVCPACGTTLAREPWPARGTGRRAPEPALDGAGAGAANHMLSQRVTDRLPGE